MLLQFTCPCGSPVNTHAFSGTYQLENGYLLQCKNCSRWYMHDCLEGRVEGVQKELSFVDSLFQRLPDEYGFLRGIIAAP